MCYTTLNPMKKQEFKITSNGTTRELKNGYLIIALGWFDYSWWRESSLNEWTLLI